MGIKPHICLIGSGLASLSAAAYLSSRDYQISIHERNSEIGGKLGEYQNNGFRFDTGPSLFTMPEIFKDLYQAMGERLENHLSLIKLDPICRYFFANGTVIDSFHELEKFQQQVEKISSADAQALASFMDYSQRIYDFSAPIFLYQDPWQALKREPLRTLKQLTGIQHLDPRRNMQQGISRFFESPEIQQLFGRYATYSGSSPYRAPATLNLIPHVEYNLGAYYLKGGIHALVKSLRDLLKQRGVNFKCDSHIKQIITRKPGIFFIPVINAIGDQEDRLWHSQAVICNSDVVWAHRELLHSKKFQNHEPSTSGIVFLWSIKGNYPQLEHHNIFFSEDYQNEFKQLDAGLMPEDATVYLNISCKTDPQDAPPNHENWFVLLNTPPLNGQNLDLLKIKKNILTKLASHGLADLEAKIVDEKIFTPHYFEQHHLSNRGSIYGISSNNRWQAFLRQPSSRSPIQGLFFAGGSAHPGGGMPLVTISGKNAAQAAIQYLERTCN